MNKGEPPLIDWITLFVVALLLLLALFGIFLYRIRQRQDEQFQPIQSYERSELVQPRIVYYPLESYAIRASITAYNPTVEQCDSTPFTMSSGKRVYEGAIANNCLSFGSRVEIDGKMYVVEDRMHQRYGCEYFDIFLWDYDEAVNWGRRHKIVKIYR